MLQSEQSFLNRSFIAPLVAADGDCSNGQGDADSSADPSRLVVETSCTLCGGRSCKDDSFIIGVLVIGKADIL